MATNLYDWGLDDHQLEIPQDDIWPKIETYRRAADAEHRARLDLQAHLARAVEANPPRIGDTVIPWAVLKVGDTTAYPIVDILAALSDAPARYLVRLSAEHDRPEWGLFAAGDFITATRREL